MYGGTIRHTYATFFVILLCLHVQIDARTSRFTSHLKKLQVDGKSRNSTNYISHLYQFRHKYMHMQEQVIPRCLTFIGNLNNVMYIKIKFWYIF